jgi:hypothetical protein
MAYYVMLNFEDADPAAGPGLVQGVKGKHVVAGIGAIGAPAEATTKVYARRALAKSSFLNKKEVVYYPCQEILQRDKDHTLNNTEVANIRKDCKSAKTIAFIIHGSPTDTEQGFSTAGGAVCSCATRPVRSRRILIITGRYR